MKCEILAKAAERVMQGWCKNWRHNPNGNVCALGAIEDAAGLHSQAERDPATKPLVIFLASLLPDHYVYHMNPVDAGIAESHREGWKAAWKVANWNNDPTRTQVEVAEMFERAADLCRAGAATNGLGTDTTESQHA